MDKLEEQLSILMGSVEAMGRHKHAEDGLIARTPGIEPEKAVERILALLDQQKQELLDALTIELKGWECGVPAKPEGIMIVKQEKLEQLFAHIGRINYNKALKDVVDELEARKAKLFAPPEAEAKDGIQ